MKETYQVTVGNETFSVSIENGSAVVDGSQYALDVAFTGGGNASILIDGTVSYASIVGSSIHPAKYHLRPGNPFQVNVDGHTHNVLVEDGRSLLLKSLQKSAPSASGSCDIVAPMPGLVAKILAAVGDSVDTGQGVVILEAMKMENEIRSSQRARIKEILVKPGQPVEKGQLLAKLVSDAEK